MSAPVRRAFCVALWLASGVALAHVGSPDLYHEGNAGPYHLLIAIRPPSAIPGWARIEVEALGGGVREVRVAPLHLENSPNLAPRGELAERQGTSNRFVGTAWLRDTGMWQALIRVDGAQGKGELPLPVPAIQSAPRHMTPFYGTSLLIGLALLVVGLAAILIAAARQAIDPIDGPINSPFAPMPRTSKIRIVALMAGVLLCFFYLEWSWWTAMEARNDEVVAVYRSPELSGRVAGNTLELSLEWPSGRSMGSFLPDHGHPMHLFMVRVPDLDRVYHLHPEPTGPRRFEQALPSLSAGRYRLFADVVNADGLPETLVTEMALPDAAGAPLAGDDSAAEAQSFGGERTVAQLSDGVRLVWERTGAVRARTPAWFRFRVERSDGSAPDDLEPYMGMAGHAVFLRRDLTVFAHVHPTGSIPAATLGLTQGGGDPHAGHRMHGSLGSRVAFPFAVPSAGDYRLFVQVKRNGRVETGTFDFHATE